MVNRGQGLAEEFVAPALAEGEFRQIDAPARWAESLTLRNDEIEVIADADVIVPNQAGNIPVQELQQKPFSEDELRFLVDYFAKGNRVYRVPKLTRERLELELENVQGRAGDYNGIWSEATLFEIGIPELIEQAPESAAKEYIGASFDFPVKDEVGILFSRYDKEEIQTQNTFSAFVDEEGIAPGIFATRHDATVGSTSCFRFDRGIRISESFLENRRIRHSVYSEWVGTNSQKVFGLEDKWLADLDFWLDMMAERMESVSFPVEAAQNRAESLIADLGISGMGLARTEKGVQIQSDEYQIFSMNQLDEGIKNSPYDAGYIFTYHRKAGELLAIPYARPFLYFYENIMDDAPSYPPEEISIFITDKGVQGFTWNHMSYVNDVVAENIRLLPFETAKQGFLDYLTYSSLAGGRWVFLPTSAKLGLANSTAFNSPGNTWLVPCWEFEYTRYAFTDAGKKDYSGVQTALVNALDGGFIPPSNMSIYPEGM